LDIISELPSNHQTDQFWLNFGSFSRQIYYIGVFKEVICIILEVIKKIILTKLNFHHMEEEKYFFFIPHVFDFWY
jgi:hypothetical protein